MARVNNLQTTPHKTARADNRTLAETSTRRNGKDVSTSDDEVRLSSSSNEANTTVTSNNDGNQLSTVVPGEYQERQEDDDAEGIAGLINDASLSGMSNSTSIAAGKAPEGMWSRISGYLLGGPQKQSTTRDDGRMSEDRSVSTPEQHAKVTAPAMPTTDVSAAHSGTKTAPSRRLPRPSAIFEDISKKHKPRSAGRPDTFDVPQSPPQGPGPDAKARNILQHAGPKTKRKYVKERSKIDTADGRQVSADGDRREDQVQRLEHIAQKTLSRTTRSKSAAAESPTTPQRATRSGRANTVEPSDLSKPLDNMSRPIPKMSSERKDPPPAVPSPSKRRRGRPPKAKPAESEVSKGSSETAKETEVVNNLKERSQQIKHKPSALELAEAELAETARVRIEAEPGTDLNAIPAKPTDARTRTAVVLPSQPMVLDVETVILPCPTPVKPAQKSSEPLYRPSNIGRRFQVRSSDAIIPPATAQPSGSKSASALTFADGQGPANSEEDPASEPPVETEHSPLEKSEEIQDMGFIKKETLEKLLSTIDEVGRNAEGTKVAHEGFNTGQARAITMLATKMTQMYETMQDLNRAEDVDIEKLEKVRQRVTQVLARLGDKSFSMVVESLEHPPPSDDSEGTELRKSILKDVYLHVVPGLVDAFNAAAKWYRDQHEIAITDLKELSTLITVILDIAKASKLGKQPITSGNNRYKLSQPTHRLVPILQQLDKQLKGELAARETAAKKENAREGVAERAKKRKERETEEARVAEEDYQDRVRERKRAIAIALEERRRELGLPPYSEPKSTIKTLSAQQRQTVKVDDDPYYDDNEDQTVREVGLFGRNNTHPGTGPKEWTRSEMEILVAGLRQDRGPTRYEKLAPRLDRTLDEIFERAKYLKAQIEYTLKRLQEENPHEKYPPVKPWIENIGSEGFQSL